MTNEQTKSSLTVDLSLRVRKGEPILARLQFTNRGSDVYELLSWLTFPGGHIDSKNYFSVNVDGWPCRYIGIMKKRGNPTAADYIAVKPGDSLTSIVSMGVFVKVMLTKAGPIDLGALLLGLANYNAKKLLGSTAEVMGPSPAQPGAVI